MRMPPLPSRIEAQPGRFDPLDVGRLWTPWRVDARSRVDSLPFHADHAELLRNTETLAYLIRTYTTWQMTCAGLGHPGGSFSEAEFLAVLFGYVLRFDASDPSWPMRDVFYLSKGHACPAVYTVLALMGYFEVERLKFYGAWGSGLESHPDATETPGIEVSGGGSLGQDPGGRRRPLPGHALQRPGPRRPHDLRAARRWRVQRGLGLGGLHGRWALQARQHRLRHRLQQGLRQGLPRAGHGPRAARRQAARLQPRRLRRPQWA